MPTALDNRSTLDETLPLVALALTPGVGSARTDALLAAFGSAEAALGATASQLREVPGIGPSLAEKIAGSAGSSRRGAAEALERAHAAGARVLCRGAEGYPALLAPLPDAPPVLFVRGSIEAEATAGAPQLPAYTVAVVGSRECGPYGLEQASRFGAGFAEAGLCVVSGGARGVDTAAHLGALRAGGRTVVVLGCGLDIAYPEENERLFRTIVEEDRGALVSELPLGTPPRAENFPPRNRIISGLSLGVVVVQAGAKSGALLTARVAVETHGREVFAVPSRVDDPAARGTLALLRDGHAHVALSAADVIGALESPARFLHAEVRSRARTEPDGRTAPRTRNAAAEGHRAGRGRVRGSSERAAPEPALRPTPRPTPPALGGGQAAIWAALAEPRSTEALMQSLQAEAGSLISDLTMLELAGRIRKLHGLWHRRA